MAKLDKAVQFPVHLFNWAFLALVLISAPYVASLQLGGVQLVATRTAQYLAIGGFGLGVMLNFLGAAFLFRGKAKLRRLCWQWCFIHVAFLGAILLVFWGYVHFDWLREWLSSAADSMGL